MPIVNKCVRRLRCIRAKEIMGLPLPCAILEIMLSLAPPLTFSVHLHEK